MLLAPEKKNQTTKPVEASSLARSSAPTLFAQKHQEHEGLSKTEVKEGGVLLAWSRHPRSASSLRRRPPSRVARDDGAPRSWKRRGGSPALPLLVAHVAPITGTGAGSGGGGERFLLRFLLLFPGRGSAWTAAGTVRTEAGDDVDRLYSRGRWPGMERLLGVDRRPNLPGRGSAGDEAAAR